VNGARACVQQSRGCSLRQIRRWSRPIRSRCFFQRPAWMEFLSALLGRFIHTSRRVNVTNAGRSIRIHPLHRLPANKRVCLSFFPCLSATMRRHLCICMHLRHRLSNRLDRFLWPRSDARRLSALPAAFYARDSCARNVLQRQRDGAKNIFNAVTRQRWLLLSLHF